MLILPGLPWLGMAAYGFWSTSGLSFCAPQEKRLIGLTPDLRMGFIGCSLANFLLSRRAARGLSAAPASA